MAKKEYFKLFVDADDMVKLHGCSRSWSYERLREMARYNNLKPHQRISIFHFCNYEGIPFEDLITLLKEAGIIKE